MAKTTKSRQVCQIAIISVLAVSLLPLAFEVIAEVKQLVLNDGIGKASANAVSSNFDWSTKTFEKIRKLDMSAQAATVNTPDVDDILKVEPITEIVDELLIAQTSTTLISPPPLSTFVRPPNIELDFGIRDLEAQRADEFEKYFGQAFTRKIVDSENIRYALYSMHRQVDSVKAAVVYISSQGEKVFIRVETADAAPILIQSTITEEVTTSEVENRFYPEEGELETSTQISPEPDTRDVRRSEVVEQVERFWQAVQDPTSDNYLQYSRQLYRLLIAPIEKELFARNVNVNTLLFSMENGLRLIPLAALYDPETDEYLTQKYKLSVIPRFSALDIRPSELFRADVLAVGISEFRNSEVYAPLSAVPLELQLIKNIWTNKNSFASPIENNIRQNTKFRSNSTATLSNLRQDRREHPFQIVHLATHANFNPGVASDSNIQLWDTTLPLNPLQIETLNWNTPPIDLLILSACRTALGDENAELGFAGLSLQAEVKSTLASLWYVGDLSTLVYMMEFYRNLSSPETKSKAEAVRKTQLAMLNRERLKQNLQELKIIIQTVLNNNDRFLIEEDGVQALTETEIQGIREIGRKLENNEDEVIDQLSHPFSWSAFTLIGSPW